MSDLNIPPIEERVVTLLEAAAELRRTCRACGEVLYFVRHKTSGCLAPYTKEAINHFVNCPESRRFKKALGGQA